MNSQQLIQRQQLATPLRLAFIAYKWVIVGPFMALSTLIFGLIIMLISALGAPNFASRVFATRWARINSAVAMMRMDVIGKERVDRSQSYIIVANHQSLIDIYALYGFLGMEIKWVMKKELRAVPILGIACEMMGHILIDRGNTSAALESINNARERIKDGVSVIFFPEGTRSRDGRLKPFKKGAFRFAQELQIPILPVVIHDTNKVLPSDTIDLMPGHAAIEFLEPISTAGLESTDITQLSRQVREKIEAALEGRSEI